MSPQAWPLRENMSLKGLMQDVQAGSKPSISVLEPMRASGLVHQPAHRVVPQNPAVELLPDQVWAFEQMRFELVKDRLHLPAEEKDKLQTLEKFDSNWRVRERVKTVLLLSQGQTCLQVAGHVGIHFRTVSYTRHSWLQEKFAVKKPSRGRLRV